MFGIWIKWPGMWVHGRNGQPVAFDTEAEAQAWMEDEGYDPDAVEVRSL